MRGNKILCQLLILELFLSLCQPTSLQHIWPLCTHIYPHPFCTHQVNLNFAAPKSAYRMPPFGLLFLSSALDHRPVMSEWQLPLAEFSYTLYFPTCGAFHESMFVYCSCSFPQARKYLSSGVSVYKCAV